MKTKKTLSIACFLYIMLSFFSVNKSGASINNKLISETQKNILPSHVIPGDSDGDGVEDGDDRCPDTPAGVEVGADGCPIPAHEDLDIDKDGVPNIYDLCPNTPFGTPVDANGCPL